MVLDVLHYIRKASLIVRQDGENSCTIDLGVLSGKQIEISWADNSVVIDNINIYPNRVYGTGIKEVRFALNKVELKTSNLEVRVDFDDDSKVKHIMVKIEKYGQVSIYDMQDKS